VGLTNTQAVGGSGYIWHVLEHTAGHQVCVSFSRAGTLFVNWTIAKNKFETAGAWRNGGSVNSAARPTDVTSSPTQDQEVDQGTTPANFIILSVVHNNTYHIAARDDGEAVFVITENNTLTADNYSMWAFWKNQNPNPADTNPWIVSAVRNLTISNMGDSTSNGITRGRTPLSGAHPYAFTRLRVVGTDLMATGNMGADPFSGNSRICPLGLWTSTSPIHIRFTIPDLCYVPASWADRDQFNGRAYTVFGDLGMPWDEATNTGGTQRTADFIALDVLGDGNGAGVSSAFNTGLEVI
jgi:hypothetical protein